MTPEPPSPPDGPQLPPRHRPTADNLAKDTTERDLWDLDDLVIGDPDGPPRATIEPIRRRRVPAAPEQKSSPAKPVEIKPATGIPVLGGRSGVIRRVSKSDLARSAPPFSPAGENGVGARPAASSTDRVETAFDELEDWDDSVSAGISRPVEEVFDVLPEKKPEEENTAPPGDRTAAEDYQEPGKPGVPAPDGPTPGPAESEEAIDEFAPREAKADAAAPGRPGVILNGIEKIGLVCLAVLFLIGGIWAYRNTVAKLDKGNRNADTELPVSGAHVKISKIDSYWRAPVTTGEKREIVRRGVVLIPVVEVAVSGKGAVRLLFSDDKGDDVGDPMVREVDGDATLVIPATVGFEDISAHAGYQAGLTKPWRVRIAEAPSTGASGADFKDLAKIRITPNLR